MHQVRHNAKLEHNYFLMENLGLNNIANEIIRKRDINEKIKNILANAKQEIAAIDYIRETDEIKTSLGEIAVYKKNDWLKQLDPLRKTLIPPNLTKQKGEDTNTIIKCETLKLINEGSTKYFDREQFMKTYNECH